LALELFHTANFDSTMRVVEDLSDLGTLSVVGGNYANMVVLCGSVCLRNTACRT
jgi:hypothetical protein